MRVWRHKNTAYTPKEHPANCPLRWRLSNSLGCISHDCKLYLVTIQGNLTGDQYIRDILPPVAVPHFDNHPLATRHVYMDDNDRQASSFKSSNLLPPKRSRDFCSLASHPGFECHGAYLGNVMPSYACSGTSCANHSSVGSRIASGMAAAITTGHPMSNWKDETQGLDRHPSTWGLQPLLNNRCN